MFTEIFNMPIAYDIGVDIKDTRNRKPHRKGIRHYKYNTKETIILTSKEVAEISGEALMKLFQRT